MKALTTSILLLIVGLGLLIGGFFVWRSQSDFVAHALHAEGTVTTLHFHGGSRGKGSYYPVVEFTAQSGQIIQFTDSSGSASPAYSRGDHVQVLYDGVDPQQASIDSFASKWSGVLTLGGVGLVFALIGGGVIWSRLNQRKVRAWLSRNGMRVQAKFEGAIYDTSSSMNGRVPWRLTAQWRHPVTQKVYSMCSDHVWHDPSDYVKGRTTLDALVNMDNPKQYRIDTSFLPKAG